MNKRIIKSVLSKKINAWAESIKDERVKSLVKKNTIVTGGCICSMLLNEDPKDYDIYFKDRETTLAVAKYYVKEFQDTHQDMDIEVKDLEDRVTVYIKSSGVAGEVSLAEPFEDAVEELEEEKDNKYRPVFLSPNAITLTDKIQIVTRFFGDVEEIHSNYDFVHTTNSWESSNKQLTLRQEALESILAKQLVYQGSKYPICSVIRTRKFVNRGWNINAGQYLKMILQINNFDLLNIEVLKDQLVGVDSAYFNKIIEGVVNKQINEPGFQLDSGYLISVVERIFD